MSATDIYTLEEIRKWVSDKFIKNGKMSPYYGRYDKVKIKFPNEVNYIEGVTGFLPNNSPWSERINCILNNINEIPKCKTCGCNNSYQGSLYLGYTKFCSMRCLSLNDEIQDKIKKTNLEKYGVEHTFQSEIGRAHV